MSSLLQSGAGTDPLALAQWGVLGVILLAIITGYLWPKPAVDEMQKRYDADKAQVLADAKLLRDELAEYRKTEATVYRQFHEQMALLESKLSTVIGLLEEDARTKRQAK